jgi:hypothetical protein
MGFMQNTLGFFGLEDVCAQNGANGCKELVLIRADFICKFRELGKSPIVTIPIFIELFDIINITRESSNV